MARAAAYGSQHQRTRRLLLPAAYNTPCALCGELMVRGQDLHLDHSQALAVNATSKGDRIVHAWCNTSAGGRLGRSMQDLRPSSRW